MKNKLIKYELPAIKRLENELREDKAKEDAEEDASITQAIVDFELGKMPRGELERKAARWKLELDALEYAFDESLKIRKKGSMEALRFWLSGIFTNDDGSPNRLGRIVNKSLSRTNTPNAKKDRPRNGAIKPTKDELEVFRVEYQGKRERDGVNGDYGWRKAAWCHYGYSERQISRIYNEK